MTRAGHKGDDNDHETICLGLPRARDYWHGFLVRRIAVVSKEPIGRGFDRGIFQRAERRSLLDDLYGNQIRKTPSSLYSPRIYPIYFLVVLLRSCPPKKTCPKASDLTLS